MFLNPNNYIVTNISSINGVLRKLILDIKSSTKTTVINGTAGKMDLSTYDSDGNGVVDNSEALDGWKLSDIQAFAANN